MAQVLVNIRMDEDLKRAMEHTCRQLGLNMTTAFTIFAKKMGREQRIPFEVSADPFYSANNQACLQKSISDYENGLSEPIIKTMAELEEMANE